MISPDGGRRLQPSPTGYLQGGRIAYTGAELLVAGYKALPVCGSAGAGPLCQDPAMVATIDKVTVTLDTAITDLTSGIAVFKAAAQVDLAALITAVVKAGVDVNAAVARFRAN